MIKTATRVLRNAIVDPSDVVCIIYDAYELEIGKAFVAAAKTLVSQGVLASFSDYNLDDFGTRPLDHFPPQISKSMHTSTLIFATIAKRQIKIGEYSTVRKPILDMHTVHGKRLGVLYDAPPSCFEDIFTYDPAAIRELNNKLLALVKKHDLIRITTPAGTDVSVSTGKHVWINQDANLTTYTDQHSLLAGEIYTCPTTVNGTMVIDGTMGGNFGKFDFTEPLIVTLKAGRVIKVDSKNQELREKFQRYLRKYEHFDRVGEIGFGTNTALSTYYGVIGVDEKFPGIHLAFGNPYPKRTGANWTCKAHIDGSMKKCSVWIGDVQVLKDGEYLI